MKYVVTMDGKKYEVGVEHVSAFHMPTREEIASNVSTPVQSVVAPASKVAASAPAAVTPVLALKVTAIPVPAAAPAIEATPGGTFVTNPVSGSMFGVKVNVSDKVGADQTMFVLETMKTRNEIVAPVDDTVASINVKAGDTADTDQIMGTLS